MKTTLNKLAALMSSKSPDEPEFHINSKDVFLKQDNEDEITLTEKYLECEFPSEIRDLYKQINGQPEVTTIFNSFRLQTLKELRDSKDNLIKHYKKEINSDGGVNEGSPIGSVKPYYYHLKWIPILRADNEEISIDLDPPAKGVYGQVVYVDFYESERIVLTSDFKVFLKDIINRIENDVIKYDKEYEYFMGESVVDEKIKEVEFSDEVTESDGIKDNILSFLIVLPFIIIQMIFVYIFRAASWVFSLFKTKP